MDDTAREALITQAEALLVRLNAIDWQSAEGEAQWTHSDLEALITKAEAVDGNALAHTGQRGMEWLKCTELSSNVALVGGTHGLSSSATASVSTTRLRGPRSSH